MNLPDSIRDQLREQMWRVADEIGCLALGPTERTQHYENWTKDPEVGGVLQRDDHHKRSDDAFGQEGLLQARLDDSIFRRVGNGRH